MPRTEDRSLADRVRALRRRADRLRPVHVKTTIVVCKRDEPWSRSVSGDAAAFSCAADIEGLLAGAHGHPPPKAPRPILVVKTIRDLDLLIDPRSGLRKLRTKENAERFDYLAAKVELVEITITVHDRQLEALLSPAPVVAVLGGNRAGKTRIGIYWLIRQWMLRGGSGSLFWILAPTDEKAWKRLGRPKADPEVVSLASLLPERLRASELPTSKRAKLEIELIDGTIVEAKNTFGDGDNLKSEKVDGILFDEAGASKHVGNWHQCVSRTTQGGARVMLATTPKAGHWAYSEIVLQEPHAGGQIECFTFDLFHNPWLTYPEIFSLLLGDGTLTATELDERVLVTEDWSATTRALVESPRALREHFGVWTADGIRLWSEWTDQIARECSRAGGDLHPRTLTTRHGELVNVTAQAASSFFYDVPNVAQVWGQDFNLNPQTCVRVQIMGRPEDLDTWTIYVIEEVQAQGTVEAIAARMKTSAPGAAIACDPSGDIPRRKQEAGDGDEASRMREHGFACRSAVGRGRRLRSQKPTLLLLHKLMRAGRFYVHTRCKQTIKALQMQQATADSRISKRAGVNSASDQLSSPTDATRYIAFALLRHELESLTTVEA